MVIRETPDGGGRMGSFMRRFPGLGHQPDIVLEGFDGRDSYTILEIKTCEPAGAGSPHGRDASREPMLGDDCHTRAVVRLRHQLAQR